MQNYIRYYKYERRIRRFEMYLTGIDLLLTGYLGNQQARCLNGVQLRVEVFSVSHVFKILSF